MPVWIYIYLAASSGLLGAGILFLLLFVCQYFGIDITQHVWLLAIPLVVAVFVNVILIEVYRKYKFK